MKETPAISIILGDRNRRYYYHILISRPTSHSRPPCCPCTSAAVAAGQTGDEDVAEGYHAVNDGHDDGADSADDALEAGPDGVEDSYDLFGTC